MLVLPLPQFPAVAVAVAEPAALMQVGPNPRGQGGAPLPIPHRRKPAASAPVRASASAPEAAAAPSASPAAAALAGATAREQSRFTECLLRGGADPAGALSAARAWLGEELSPEARVAASLCLGQLLAQQGDFTGAENAFGTAAAAIPPERAGAGVPLMAMAGNAALAGGRAEAAVDWFDKALAVPGNPDNAALGAIQIDRSRALVAAGRLAEAGGALEEAHRLAPEDPEGWLLSATLARRNGDLPRAQRDIEVAFSLDPRDPAIGLEAGVIAMLDGREAAARKSWESVVKASPGSDEAGAAQGYLDQIGMATPSPEPARGPEQ